MHATYFVSLSLLSASVITTATADDTEAPITNPIAAAFGAAPISELRLSPNGEQLVQIQMHPSGVSVARLADLTTGAITMLVAGSRDWAAPRDVTWCGWKNDVRLICGMRAIGLRSFSRGNARLAGVDRDGGNLQMLTGQRRTKSAARPYRLIDWLPDDPEHVLATIDNPNGSGYNVARFDIYDGTATEEHAGPIQILDWVTDAHGEPRLYRRITEYTYHERWYVRDTPNSAYSVLHDKPLTDTEDAFTPVGFAREGNELLIFDDNGGRRALFALDLDQGRSRRVIYAHDRLDVTAVHSLGKDQRPVAATYIDDRLRFAFLDERVAGIHTVVQALFAGKTVSIVDEDWNRRYYLVLVDGADDAGTYYRFDSNGNVLVELFAAYPELSGRPLAPVREVSYPAYDGTQIPAYLTKPSSRADGPPPAIVLPHDGPASRDYLRFDALAQYLAASGYAVLQPNYRGSAGYGKEWAGQGGYRDWALAIRDIAAGIEYLTRERIADPDRICAVGAGYGGYAALMSVIENPGQYRCVASIAGVTDPRSHGETGRDYVDGRAHTSFVGTNDEVLDAGSPLERVDEIQVPVLLFHGAADGEVLLQQSAALARALRRRGKNSELVEYEYAEHDFRADRVDLMTRLGAFLSEHLAQAP